MTLFKKHIWVLLPIFLILIVYIEWLQDPTQPIKLFFLGLFCFCVNLYLLVNWKTIEFKSIFPSTVKVYSIYLAIGLISLLNTEYFALGIVDWLKLFLFFNLLILISHYLNTSKKELVYSRLAIFFTFFQIVAISSLFYFLNDPEIEIIWFKTKVTGGIYVNSNLLSQLLFLSLPFSLYDVLCQNNSRWKVVSGATTLISILTLFLLGSKVVLFSLCIMGLISVAYMLSLKHKAVSSKVKVGLISSMVIVIFAVAFLLINNGSSVLKTDSFGIRQELWERTISSIEDKPIIGHGIGSWYVTNLNYIPLDKEFTTNAQKEYIYSSAASTTYLRPHNDYLWIWSELGSLGLLAYVVFLGFAFYYAFKAIRRSDMKTKLFCVFLLSALLGYSIFSFFSFPKERVEHILILALIISILTHLSNKKSEEAKKNRKTLLLTSFLFLMSIPLVFVSYQRLLSHYHFTQAIIAMDLSNWEIVQKESKLAKNELYKIGSNGMPIDWYTGSAFMNLNRVDEAYRFFKKAYDIHPNQVHVINNLATAAIMMDKVEEGKSLYKEAITINPNFEDSRINLSGVYFNEGNLDEAWAQISQVDHRTNHPHYRGFIQAILKRKYGNSLLSMAEKGAYTNEAIAFLQSDELQYFSLYTESINKSKRIEDVFEEQFIDINN